MAAPNYQAAGGITSANASTNTTVAWPTHQKGDLGILCVYRRASTYGAWPELVTPNGFRRLDYSTGRNTIGTTGVLLSLFWCLATSNAMSSPVVDHDGFGASSSIIFTFRGVDQLNPVTCKLPEPNRGGSTAYNSGYNMPSRVVTDTLVAFIGTIPGTSVSVSAENATGISSLTERYDARAGNAGFFVVDGTHSQDNPGPFNATLSSSAVPAGAMLSIFPPSPRLPAQGLSPYHIR